MLMEKDKNFLSPNEEELYNLLHEYLEYDYSDGELRWIKRPSNRVQIGDPAGTVNPDGYIQLQFFGKLYKAHNLVWFMCYGKWPENILDHKDRDRANNRLDNLQDVTNRVNTQLGVMHHDNESGHKGVSYDLKYEAKPWRVQISRDGKVIHRSHHEDCDDACEQARAIYIELGSRL